MKEEPELPRLLDSDDVPGELRQALGGLRALRPSAAQMASLAASLSVPAAPGETTAPSPETSTAGTAAGHAAAGKLLGGAAVVLAGAGILGSLWFGSGDRAPAEDAPARPHDAPRESRAPAHGEAQPDSRSLRNAPASPGSPAGDLRPSEPSAATDGTQRTAPDGPGRAAADEPTAPMRQAEPGEAPPRESGSTAAKASAPHVADPRGAIRRPTVPATEPRTSEMALLREARASLPVDPAEALAFTERHRREFPSGSLAQEREMLAITALMKLGNTSEAAKRADRFRRAYPTSAYLKQLERILPSR